MILLHQITLRRALLTFACTAGLAAMPVLAQDSSPATQPAQQQDAQGRGGEMQQRQLDHLTKALNLTPDQVSKVKEIQITSRQQMEALRSDSTTAPDDKRAKMMSVRQTAQSNIRAILTDDQKTKFDAMQAEMREHRGQHQTGEQTASPAPPSN